MLAIDPITLEVVRGSLVATALQMRATLIRTAYAPIIYETLDFSCGLLTAEGELAAMSEDFSGHVFAMALGLKDTQAKFADDIHPGDVIAVNDPYTGGTHMNDTAFYTPFFFDGDILLFIGVRAHWADVGGATPGSFSGQDTEIYQEGMRIVPVKIERRRRAEATEEWRKRYDIRAGIEGTNSELKRAHGLGRLRVRGGRRVRLAVYLKALACNFKRMVHALVEMENTAQPEVGTVPAVAAA